MQHMPVIQNEIKSTQDREIILVKPEISTICVDYTKGKE